MNKTNFRYSVLTVMFHLSTLISLTSSMCIPVSRIIFYKISLPTKLLALLMLMYCATVLPFLLLYATKSEYLILSKSTLKILIISLRYGVSPSSSPWSDPVRPISVDGLHRVLHQHGLCPVFGLGHTPFTSQVCRKEFSSLGCSLYCNPHKFWICWWLAHRTVDLSLGFHP
jgi:hypothetical protein